MKKLHLQKLRQFNIIGKIKILFCDKVVEKNEMEKYNAPPPAERKRLK